MENPQPPACVRSGDSVENRTESFSYSWLVDRKPNHSPENSREKEQNFNFNLPIMNSPNSLVHADEIFSDGHIMPIYINRSKLKSLQKSSTFSVPPSPISSFVSGGKKHFFPLKWRRSLKKCLGFMNPFVGFSRKSIRVDDLERKVCEVESWGNSVEASPIRTASASAYGKADFNYGLRKARSCSSTPQAISPSRYVLVLHWQKELEILILMKEREGTSEGEDKGHGDMSMDKFSKFMKNNRLEVEFQESMSLNAANAIMAKLRFQLEPFRVVTDEKSPWEEKSAFKRLADKVEKHKRNKCWRKKKRRRIAENLAKESERFDQIDKEADEWRAREIAKDIAQRKVEKMKEIAKLKEKEEKKRLESELELVLIVEKLQELRSMRIQKLKKQGHFFPEEDDKFLERVRAAVEEEELQSLAAADTEAAKEAIATAEESRKHIQSRSPESEEPDLNNGGDKESQDQKNKTVNETTPKTVDITESKKDESNLPGSSSIYNIVANLPMEFYHYYHGSNTDMGTLIEVRRTWDAYIRPGGSRIPGHWVQPPPPSDEIWASYLVKPR
ncbi:hypothetical protein BUALT_Bualt01G0233800 [Buddleja alternifolia]|uniref:Uncharacterized protein n=1 Tax=Buddleja alternifolia TaxID=168488 RepID=A0AAV6YAM0_9LAMI|nr:hypothetical protein BUALT_Bualt01G0233800 [Buddleja alternifolia]